MQHNKAGSRDRKEKQPLLGGVELKSASPSVETPYQTKKHTSFKLGLTFFSLSYLGVLAALFYCTVKQILYAKALLATWYFSISILTISLLLAGFLFVRLYKRWDFYSTQEKWEFGLAIVGVIGIGWLSLTAGMLPTDLLISTSVLGPFSLLAILTIMSIAYFFGKPSVFESHAEAAWRWLKLHDNAKCQELITELAQQISLYVQDDDLLFGGRRASLVISTENKKLLLEFLNNVIAVLGDDGLILAGGRGPTQGVSQRGDRRWSQIMPDRVSLSDVENLRNLKNEIETNARLTLNDEQFIEICNRFRKLVVYDDDRAARNKKIGFVCCGFIFLGAVVGVGALLFTKTSVLSAVGGINIGGFVLVGIALVLLAIKKVMEFLRNRANCYDEYIGKVRPPSKKITIERWVVWIGGVLLFSFSTAFAALYGINSFAFWFLIGLTVAWGVGQKLAVKSEELRLEELQKSAAESRDNNEAEKQRLGLQHIIEEGPAEIKRVGIKGLHFYALPQRSIIRDKDVPIADALARGSLVVGAFTGVLGSTLSTDLYSFFSNPFFSAGWQMVNGAKLMQSAYTSYHDYWKNRRHFEKVLVSAEVMAGTFVLGTSLFSTVAKIDHKAFGESNAVIQSLDHYALAVAMTVFAARAFYEFVIAYLESTPRILLERKIERYLSLDHDTPEKEHLLRQILAIARVKKNEILEAGQTMDSFFRNCGVREGDSFLTLYSEHPKPTAEEKLFVETFLHDKKQRWMSQLKSFFVYFFAGLCFWILAGLGVSLSLLSTGGVANFYLALSGVLQLWHLVSASLGHFKEKATVGLREEFLTEIQEPLLAFDCFGKKKSRAIGVEDDAFMTFFNKHAELSDKEKSMYRIAYYLRIDKALTVADYLNTLHQNPEKEAILNAALNEFIIRSWQCRQGDNKSNDFLETLMKQLNISPASAAPAAFPAIRERDSVRVFYGDVNVMHKAATALLKTGVFKIAGAVAAAKPPKEKKRKKKKNKSKSDEYIRVDDASRPVAMAGR